MSGTEHDAELLDAIASSEADGPRLAYADWLLQNGDPRGELLRRQCDLRAGRGDEASRRRALELVEAHHRTYLDAPYDALERRERFLLDEHHRTWIGMPHHRAIVWELDRGIPTGRFSHEGLFVVPAEHGSDGELHWAFIRFFFDAVAFWGIMHGKTPRPADLGRLAEARRINGIAPDPYRVVFAPPAPPTVEMTNWNFANHFLEFRLTRGEVALVFKAQTPILRFELRLDITPPSKAAYSTGRQRASPLAD